MLAGNSIASLAGGKPLAKIDWNTPDLKVVTKTIEAK